MFIFINKELDENKCFKEVLSFGSIKALEKHKILLKGKEMTYMQLSYRLKENGHWENSDFCIKKVTELIRSKRSKTKKEGKK